MSSASPIRIAATPRHRAVKNWSVIRDFDPLAERLAFPATIVTNLVGHNVYGLHDVLVDVQILVHWPAPSRGFQRPALSARMADTAT